MTALFNLPKISIRLLPYILLGIGLVTLLSRLVFWEHTIYNSDEAYLTIYALKLSHFFELPWSEVPMGGIRTSFGFRNPPFLIYLFTPVFSISSDPRFAVFMVMLLGAAAVSIVCYAAYCMADHFFPSDDKDHVNPMAFSPLIVSAVLMIFSPNAVQHTRQLWGHDLIIFYSSVCVLGAVKSLIELRARWLIVSIAGVFMAQACHLSGVLLWTLPLFVFFKLPLLKSKIKAIAAFILVGLFIYGPWIINEAGWLQESNPEFVAFESFKVIGSIFSGSANTNPVETPVMPLFAWMGLFADSHRLDLLGEMYAEILYLNPIIGAVTILLHVFSAAFVLGAVIFAFRILFLKQNTDENEVKVSLLKQFGTILLITSLLPLLVFQLLPISSVPLYQLPAFVPLVLLVALAVLFIIRNFEKAKLLIQIVLFAFIFCAVFHSLVVYVRVSNATFETPVATTLQTKIRTIWLINEFAENGPNPENFTILQDGRAISAGVDVWVGSLYYAYTGSRKSPIVEGADQALVIVDNKTILREPLELYLEDKRFTPINTIRIYNFIGQRKDEWQALTVAYPSARPEDLE